MPRRFAGGAAAAALLTFAVWKWTESLLYLHNAIAFTLLDIAGIEGAQAVATTVFGRPVPVLVTVSSADAFWSYGPVVAAVAALIVLAVLVPVARGLAAFLLTIIAASVVAYQLGAGGMRRPETFPVMWTQTELLVWVVLPSMSALLFVTAQPSWLRGICWMAAIEAFAVFWSAARFVVILGVAQASGPMLLPALWFAWGLLADVLYITTFFSLAVHVNLRLSPERRLTWAS